MKNILNYYYHIIVNDSDLESGYFTYNNYYFCLYEYKRNIEEIKSLVLVNNYMINSNILTNKIIFNIFNEALTFFEGKYYVLIMIINNNRKISYPPTLAMVNNDTKILERNNWGYLWSIKIDYIEYQIMHLEKKYPLIHKTINYYIGLGENAIFYFNMIKLENTPLYFNHRRITKNNFYNPVEIIIDYKIRDICEYLKKCFFNDEKSISDIKSIILKLDLNYVDSILFYIRMLYPSFYFDIYEQIINNNMNEKVINQIINKALLYEKLLFEIYVVLKRKYNIIGIDWINKKFA